MAKVIFLYLFVILITGGGGLLQCMLGYHPPRRRHLPPKKEAPPHTVNEQPVDILLESILIFNEIIFIQLIELDELDRIMNYSLTHVQKTC